ncbi:hypothetical protein [Bifidobacterium mongoliense]|nr:hypothetical protein [Bifidobacterium mongoliense]
MTDVNANWVTDAIFIGENAGYVLMIGDDEENKEVLESAKEIIQ